MLNRTDAVNDLKDVLWEKSEGFKNPDEKPDACPSCGSKELKEETIRKPFKTHAVTPPGEKGPEEERFVLYCQTCNTVLWVDGLTSIPFSMLDQFGV